MDLNQFYQRFQLDKSLEKCTEFTPYYREIQSGLSDPLVVEGESFINLASNNYLGLAGDARVKKAAMEAIEKYGTSLCGTPIATGYIDLFKSLEERLANFVGLESALILPSCYQANNGLFTAIAGKEDLILIDHYAHSSLVQGVKAAGSRIRPFLHNNMEHLQDILKKSAGYRQIFLVTESIFSTDGSIAPIKDIVYLAGKYGAVPVIDDSHGIGVLGKTGRGILEEMKIGIGDYPGIYTASLGKALANTGGIIAGRKDLMDYLRYYLPHLVYSTAVSPAVLAGIDKVLEIMKEDCENILGRLWKYKSLLSEGLSAAGFKLAEGKAPITSILTGSEEKTIKLAKEFYANKVMTTPFIFPSVPANEGKVRLIAGANLKEETINQLLGIIKKMGQKI